MIARLVVSLLLIVAPLPAVAADWYTGAKPQQATDDWIVSVDASTDITTQSSYFADVLITAAPVGTLNESGVRVRADGGAGLYSYYSTTDARELHGKQESGAFLAGYEWVSPTTVFAAYIGGDIRNNTLSFTDTSNNTVGTSFGAKGQLEFYTKPTLNTMIAGNVSYATNKTAYFARLRTGYLVGPNIYIGPEIVALGDSFFNQERIGAQLSGLHAGPLQFGFAAGYLYDRVRGSGAYTTVDARIGF